MAQLALGLIETVGLAAGIEAADAAVKSANVRLIGYELTKGDGMATIKVEGDVGAVKAAVDAAVSAATRVGKVFSSHVIPRPANGLENVVFSKDTVGLEMAPKQEETKEQERPFEEPIKPQAQESAPLEVVAEEAPVVETVVEEDPIVEVVVEETPVVEVAVEEIPEAEAATEQNEQEQLDAEQPTDADNDIASDESKGKSNGKPSTRKKKRP